MAVANVGYPSEICLKLNSRKISSFRNLFLSCAIILKFCTEHGSDTAMLCANFQNDWTTEVCVIGERDSARLVAWHFPHEMVQAEDDFSHHVWCILNKS